MTRIKTLFVRALSLVILGIFIPVPALADDFGMIVKNIERHYHARKKKIPFLGLAGLAVKIIHPAGVKSVKFAMFEDQDFHPGERDRSFEEAVRSSLNSKWKPMVRSKSRSSGNRSYVYSHDSGDDLEMLSVTFSTRQAIVVQAKVNPDAVARFLDKPEILGFSLSGMGGSPSIFNPSVGGGGDVSAPSQDSSLDSLGGETMSSTPAAPTSKPTLKRRSDDDSEFNPLSTEARAIAGSKPEEGVIRLEARLINLNVKAIDRSGSSLSDLRKEDFKVFEDGVEQDVSYFEPVSAPINLVLLLDLSGSTRDNRQVMIETAKKFIDSLGSGDRVAIAGFTRRFTLLSDFTQDKKHLKQAVEKVKKIAGGTAFYDAMWETLDLLQKVNDSRKAIVVLTDGVDNSIVEHGYEPTNHTFDELLGRVSEEDVSIYPIYFNREEPRLLADLRNSALPPWTRERIEKRLKPNETAHRQVEMLAEESSGTVFVAEGENELDGVYQRVAAELRLIYTLAYAPKRVTHDGKYKKISVAVQREGALARTRRGYVSK